MHTRELAGGAVLILIGAAATAYSLASLRLGTLQRLGPGGFPTALGILLVIFGLIILIPALNRTGGFPKIEFVPLAAILASIVSFGFLLRTVGLVPAAAVMILIASRADRRLSLARAAMLAACLALVAALIFPIGLGIRIPIFTWRW
jgi:hypothetical protein